MRSNISKKLETHQGKNNTPRTVAFFCKIIIAHLFYKYCLKNVSGDYKWQKMRVLRSICIHIIFQHIRLWTERKHTIAELLGICPRFNGRFHFIWPRQCDKVGGVRRINYYNFAIGWNFDFCSSESGDARWGWFLVCS